MRGIKTLLIVGACLALSLSSVASAGALADEIVRIGFVLDGPSEHNGPALTLWQDEIGKLLQNDCAFAFPPEATLTGDFSIASVRNALDRLLGDDSIDIIVPLGLLASMDATQRDELVKPIVAPLILDSKAQGVPMLNGTSGLPNLSYLESPFSIARELGTFKQVAHFRKLAFLANRSALEQIEGLGEKARETTDALDIDVTIVPVAGSAAEALAAIPADTEAVYLVPLVQLAPGEFDALIAGLNERRLPSFSFLGRPDVERGVLAGIGSDSWLPQLARRTALNIQRILRGEKAADLPVAIVRREELVLNMATARRIGFDPSFDVLTEAELIDTESRETSRTISLQDAVRIALQTNRDLRADIERINAGAAGVARANAPLLPQIDLQGRHTTVDADRAEASFGSVAERTLQASVGFTQVLWSEGAWANRNIQGKLQEARRQDGERLRLDIAQAAATGYLNLLRAKSNERIRRENLRLTRSHFELAQLRQSLGVSGPAEVYRWQSQIASERQSSIKANAQRNLAEMELNRLLNRPSEESFQTLEVDLGEHAPGNSNSGFAGYPGSPGKLKILREFLVH